MQLQGLKIACLNISAPGNLQKERFWPLTEPHVGSDVITGKRMPSFVCFMVTAI